MFKANLKSSGNNLVPFVLIKLGVFIVCERQALTPLPRGVSCFDLMESDPDEQTLKKGINIEHPGIFSVRLGGSVYGWLFRVTHWLRGWSGDCAPLNFSVWC